MSNLCISDPSIRALILNIDSRTHDIIIEVSEKGVCVLGTGCWLELKELDDTHLLIDSNKLDYLKKKLGDTLDENTFNPNEVEEK